MTAVSFGVYTDHIGHIRTFNVGSIEHLLTDVIKLVGEDASLNSQGIIIMLANKLVHNLSEPPNT
jgi:hypothetical protein